METGNGRSNAHVFVGMRIKICSYLVTFSFPRRCEAGVSAIILTGSMAKRQTKVAKHVKAYHFAISVYSTALSQRIFSLLFKAMYYYYLSFLG